MNGRILKDVGDPTVNIAYTLYRDALNKGGYGNLIKKWELDKVMTNLDQAKRLSEYIKKKGANAEEHWRYLVDLHRLRDFLPYATEDAFIDDIVDWVQRKPVHSWNGDEEEWYRRFEQHAEKVLFSSGRPPEKIISIDEFVTNGDLWCTSGSGFEPGTDKLRVFNRKKDSEVEVKKTKWSVRWNLSKYEIKRKLWKKREQICKAVQKSEPGKVRAVISSDLSLYLKMSYISTFLDQILRGRTDSTLFMSKDDRFDLWQKMAFDGTYRMPLDQSEFDKNVTRRQVLILLKVLKKLIAHFGATKEMLDIMDLIIYALSGGYVIIGGQRVYILNGILSGWRWTALLDTLVNLIELSMAKEWVEENSSIKVLLKDYNAQGDDDWLKFEDRKSAIAIWLAYESFGLFVNPGKFFLDTTRDEYLRRVYDKGKITGYPARSVTGICFRNPVSEKETVGPDRIRQSLNKWKLFAERLDVDFENSWFFDRWVQDSVQGTRGITKKEVVDWFKQSAWVGGIGYNMPPVTDNPVPTASIFEKDPIEIKTEGYTEWVKFAADYGVDEKTCLRFASSTLEFANAKLPSWVKYIIANPPVDAGVESGSDWKRPGSIAIGLNMKQKAKFLGIRWFPSISVAKQNGHYDSWQFELPKFVYDDFKITRLNKSRNKYRLDVVDGISLTLAQLSSKPELVYQNLNTTRFEGKPKSWVKDYFSGKLKKFVSIRAGWGTDAIGYVADKLFNTCVNIFLSMHKPTLGLWDSLLASADAAVPRYLSLLPVRIVE
jgi:hypothetical protein